MNEKDIQNALYVHLLRKSRVACPNYTTPGWWEADLWTVSPSGYAAEYEVKISKKDFRSDSLKTVDRFQAARHRRNGTEPKTKHQRLASGDVRGPSRFYFVTPEGLLAPEDIPPWAGWIEVNKNGRWTVPTIRKSAPQLHRQKVDPKVEAHCRSVFYWRYWNLRQTICSCQRDAVDKLSVR